MADRFAGEGGNPFKVVRLRSAMPTLFTMICFIAVLLDPLARAP
jgi:hypothetical protein